MLPHTLQRHRDFALPQKQPAPRVVVKRDAVFTNQFCVDAMHHCPAAHPVIIAFTPNQPDIQRTLLRQQGSQQAVTGRAVIPTNSETREVLAEVVFSGVRPGYRRCQAAS